MRGIRRNNESAISMGERQWRLAEGGRKVADKEWEVGVRDAAAGGGVNERCSWCDGGLEKGEDEISYRERGGWWW